MSSQSERRSRRSLSSRARAKNRRASATQAEQERAAQQRDMDRQFRRWSRRRLVAWGLFIVAGFIGVQHVFAHLGWQPLPMTMGWQDLTVGYPTAVAVALAGLLVIGKDPIRR